MKLVRAPLLLVGAAVILSGCGASVEPTSPTPILDTTPPPAPEGLALDFDASGERYLEWSPSAAADLAGYQVYLYSPDPGRDNSYVLVRDVAGATTRLPLPPVARAATYIYRIRAVDQAGNRSGFSSSFGVEISALAPVPTDPAIEPASSEPSAPPQTPRRPVDS